MPRKLRKRMPDIHEHYRHILEMPRVSATEIVEMRKCLKLPGVTICEHDRERKFY